MKIELFKISDAAKVCNYREVHHIVKDKPNNKCNNLIWLTKKQHKGE